MARTFSNVCCWTETCPTCRFLWARSSSSSGGGEGGGGAVRRLRRRCRKVEPGWLNGAASSAAWADPPCVLTWCLAEVSDILNPRLPWYFKTEPVESGSTMKMYLTDHEERVELYTPIGTPKLGLMQQLPDLNITEALQLAKSQMEDCVRDHGASCNEDPSLLGPLPARLLEIVDSGTRIRLVDLDDDDDDDDHDGREREGVGSWESVRYAALSYVWGPNDPNHPFVRTTAETKEAAKTRGLAVTELPRTLADAVVVTSLLGLKYLWIDALCIVQGCAVDWSRESSKMAAVYGRAFVTLIAAACESCHDPLLPVEDLRDATGARLMDSLCVGRAYRYPWKGEAKTMARVDMGHANGGGDGVAHVRVRTASRVGCHAVEEPMWTELGAEPIRRRAWCMQEEFLSSRYIKFLHGDLQWACRRTMGCQCSGAGAHNRRGGQQQQQQQPSVVMMKSTTANQPQDLLDIEAKVGSDPQRAWAQLVEDYSRRLLTNEQDRLPAMAGLASRFAEHLHGGSQLTLSSSPSSSPPSPSDISSSFSSSSSSSSSSKSSLFSWEHVSLTPNAARYLAGIWAGGTTSLAVQLGWRRLTPEEVPEQQHSGTIDDNNLPLWRQVATKPSNRYPTSYVAPSFSWASISAPVSYEFLKEQREQLSRADRSLGGPREYVEELLGSSTTTTTTTSTTARATSDPFGRVSAGHISLRVPLLGGKLELGSQHNITVKTSFPYHAETLDAARQHDPTTAESNEITPGKVSLPLWSGFDHYVWFVADGPLGASFRHGRWTAARLGATTAPSCMSSSPLSSSVAATPGQGVQEEEEEERDDERNGSENPGRSRSERRMEDGDKLGSTVSELDVYVALLGDTLRETGIQEGDLSGGIIGILLGESTATVPGSGCLERLGYCHIHTRESDTWVRTRAWEKHMTDIMII